MQGFSTCLGWCCRSHCQSIIMPELTQTYTHMHARTCTHKHMYTNAARYCIVHSGLQDLALKISTTWYYGVMEINIQKASESVLSQNKLWMTTDVVPTFIHFTFRPHQSVFIEMFAALHTHMHTCTEDALGWWSHLFSVSQRLRWSMGLWDEKERGEDSCCGTESDSNQFEERYTLLCWKCRLLHPCLKWQLIFLRSSAKKHRLLSSPCENLKSLTKTFILRQKVWTMTKKWIHCESVNALI